MGPAFDKRMVRHLVSTYGRAAHGGVRFYELDNEPDLWNSTHRDVHPRPLSERELWSKSKATAEAVKSADPTAGVLGPSDWGWCAYYFSAVDDCGSSTQDRDAHGGLPLGQWYLKQFAHAQHSSGTRLLDYFDEHFYPQETGVALSPAGDATTQALRLRSTRALWDPRYVDESWISQANGGKPLAWIRTMRAWVKRYYPGTKTAISEYNWGALDSINGALAQADVLGIFGRERLGLATLWGPTNAGDPWAYAFRMYRDYDGHGATVRDHLRAGRQQQPGPAGRVRRDARQRRSAHDDGHQQDRVVAALADRAPPLRRALEGACLQVLVGSPAQDRATRRGARTPSAPHHDVPGELDHPAGAPPPLTADRSCGSADRRRTTPRDCPASQGYAVRGRGVDEGADEDADWTWMWMWRWSVTRGRRVATIVLGAVTLGLLAACGTGGSDDTSLGPATGRTPSQHRTPMNAPADVVPPFHRGTGRQTAKKSGAWDLVLTDVRVAEHPGFDRVVLVFEGSTTPGWAVDYVHEAVLDGSGRHVALKGEAFLNISASGTVWPARDYYDGPTRWEPESAGPVEDVHVGGTFEGYTQVLVGIGRGPTPFRAFALTEPSRLVVDVAER